MDFRDHGTGGKPGYTDKGVIETTSEEGNQDRKFTAMVLVVDLIRLLVELVSI